MKPRYNVYNRRLSFEQCESRDLLSSISVLSSFSNAIQYQSSGNDFVAESPLIVSPQDDNSHSTILDDDACDSWLDDIVNSVAISELKSLGTLTPAFISDGKAYYPLSEVSARRVLFASGDDELNFDSEDAVVLSFEDNINEEVDNLRDSSGGGESYYISLSVDASNTSDDVNLSSYTNPLVEGHGYEPESNNPLLNANYIVVTAPSLPPNYEATISFSGSATLGSDYEVYVSYDVLAGFESVGGITYSGGSTTFYIFPLDDDWVENTAESVVATLNQPVMQGSGGSDEYNFTYGVLTVSTTIVDNDALALNVVSFKNNLNLLNDANNAFGTSWKDGPHWRCGFSSLTLPVAYSSSDTLSAYATIIGSLVPEYSYEIRVSRVNGGESDWTTFTGNAINVSFTESFAEIFGFQCAHYDSQCTLRWEFRVNGEVRSFEEGADESVNPLYVTYDTPTTDNLYLTVVHHSCIAASNANLATIYPEDTEEEIANKKEANEISVFRAICAKFATLSIRKVYLVNGNVVEGSGDENIITYYGKDLESNNNNTLNDVKACLSYAYINGNPVLLETPSRAREFAQSSSYSTGTTAGLLYHLDGTCGGWKFLALDFCYSQGLAQTTGVAITLANNNNSTLNFRVNPQLPGQGNITPRESIWPDHGIIAFRGIYFDPSYGLFYGEGENSEIQDFINGLDSIGLDSTVAQYNNYGHCYTPLKSSVEITVSDVQFT